MPYYRRRRWWFRPYRRRYRTTRRRRRPRTYRTRRTQRRRFKKPLRHRRRRRHRVRRKRQKINLKQYQPESIRRCKIKGYDVMVMGAAGREMYSYTYTQEHWIPPRTPGGGGFGVMLYSLDYLYEQHTYGRNVWTTSNCDYDLVRYTGCNFIFYRHPEVSFILTYSRQYPMVIGKHTYQQTHPSMLLLANKKVIIQSQQLNPKGKTKVKLKIKPPRQMSTKWFFQSQFSSFGLVLFQVSAISLNYPHLSPTAQNRLVTIYCLNIYDLYTQPKWGTAGDAYKPGNSPFASQATVDYYPQNSTTKKQFNTTTTTKTQKEGVFSAEFLQSSVVYNKGTTSNYKTWPILAHRYNPTIDTGKGNEVYFISVIGNSSYAPPTTDVVMYWTGKPLWLLLWGTIDYIKKYKKSQSALQGYICCIRSQAIEPRHDNKTYVVVNEDFIRGYNPYNESLTTQQANNWILTLDQQEISLNNIVKAGPYTPKQDYSKRNWELHCKYTFYTKWGGAFPPKTGACDPLLQEHFAVPDTVKKTLQVLDPKKQIPETLFHTFDYRRGQITKSAIKRMQENLSYAESSPEEDVHQPQKKKRKKADPPCEEDQDSSIITCLQTLCEEPTCQGDQLQLQLKKQQQHSNKVKLSMLHLLSKLKERQLQLQLATGLLE
nr:MAG: ORF1 [Torque teno midi virus]